MFAETVPYGRTEWYFRFSELCKKLRVKDKRTISSAIAGLVEKKSVEILVDKRGDHLGRCYRVYSPEEIVALRQASGIILHPQTKKIIS